MVKYFENHTIFNFSWEKVVQGFWHRYPNPESVHVLSEDTISREIKDGKLYTKRLLTKTNRVPKWGERFIGAPIVKIVEESIVDPKKKTLVTYTRNLGYTRVMSLTEKVTYRPDVNNPDQTIAERSAWIDSQMLGFRTAIQAFGVERFRKNCIKMVRGFNHVLETMFPAMHETSIPIIINSNTSSAHLVSHKLKDAAKKAAGKLAKAKEDTIYATATAREPS